MYDIFLVKCYMYPQIDKYTTSVYIIMRGYVRFRSALAFEIRPMYHLIIRFSLFGSWRLSVGGGLSADLFCWIRDPSTRAPMGVPWSCTHMYIRTQYYFRNRSFMNLHIYGSHVNIFNVAFCGIKYLIWPWFFKDLYMCIPRNCAST